MLQRLFVFLCLCLLTQSLGAQDAATPTVVHSNRIAQATQQLLADEALRNASISFAVLEVANGRIVESYQATRSQVPASILKLSTTATALAALGSDFRWQTELCYTGRIVDSVLRGDIVIVGGGDPTLGGGRPSGALELDALLARWVAAVKNVGIARIEGGVIADESYLPGAEPAPSWQWDDIGNYYGAGAGGLMIHENYYTLKLQQSSKVGNQPIILRTEPANIPIRWTNVLESAEARSGDQSYIFGAPGSYDRVIRGTIPIGRGTYSVKGALPDPAKAAATWLKNSLTEAGIQVAGDPSTRSQKVSTTSTIDTYYSPPLGAVAQMTNYRSVNLFAEAIYTALAKRWGTIGDGEATGDKLIAYWLDRGIPSEGWAQVDGSGLAANNLITPLQLAQVLRKSVGHGLRETIPQVGSEGTVGNLLRGDPRAMRLRAKSGTLSRVRAFAGYAQQPDGTELAFVVIANNFTGRGSDIRRALGNWMGALVE